jgi:hypothetical protein
VPYLLGISVPKLAMVPSFLYGTKLPIKVLNIANIAEAEFWDNIITALLNAGV